MAVLIVLLCCLSGGLFILLLLQRQRFYRLYESVIFSLDLALAGREQEVSLYLNTRYSAVASRLAELEKRINYEVESEKLSKEKIQAFISDLSHEIRTPLTNIIMYQDILVKKAGLTDELKEKQEKMTEQIRKMEWILGSLFKSVYLEEDYLAFDLDYTNLTETISMAVSAVLKKAIDKNIEIGIEPYEDRCVLHNKKWTAEALANILENSIKYSPAATQIQIRVGHGGMFTEIAIKDEGIGIDKEEYPFVFKRFYRGREVREMEGSGIGLYLVKMIVEKEKGYVVIKSEKGSGTVVSVFLQNTL